ncbi:hypothetical protein [Alkalispirochaeta alkalica]|uniref:hypothetical protein n=1 Tax=Alkalispirochaeta alkalica TaxID=46356 RepID=UPI00037A1ECF|nr:hypothetical protein [Alkalispirochaeta alkalica]
MVRGFFCAVARSFSSPGRGLPVLVVAAALCALVPAPLHRLAADGEGLTTPAGADRPHWIPAGTVSPELEQRALQQQVFLQHHSRGVQRQGLAMIRSSLDRFDRADLRVSAVPLVVDMLNRDYHILRVSARYQVDSPTRAEALQLLDALGGDAARAQVRRSLEADPDGTVRATAALLLARSPRTSPDEDLAAIAVSLRRATRRGGPEEELHRLLQAARAMIPHAWDPEVPDLVHALGEIARGAYSSGLRRSSLSMLEELVRR